MNKADIEEMNAASERLANLMSSFVSPELVQRLNAIDSSPTEDGVFRSKARMLEVCIFQVSEYQILTF